jgi:hypothetical protein
MHIIDVACTSTRRHCSVRPFPSAPFSSAQRTNAQLDSTPPQAPTLFTPTPSPPHTPPPIHTYNTGRSAGAEPGGNRRQAQLPNDPTETESADADPLSTTPVRSGPTLARCLQSTAPGAHIQCQHGRLPLPPGVERHRHASRAPDPPYGHEQGAPCLGLPTDPSRRAYGPQCPAAGAHPLRPTECAHPNGVKFIPELSPFGLSSHSTNRPVCPISRL